MRESGGRGGGEEEHQLNVAWAEAEKAGHLVGTFARLAELAPEQAKLLARACPLSVRVTARLLEDGEKDTHSEALLRAYSVAGNIYFCPEMSRGIESALPCTAAGKGHQSALLIQRQRRRHRQRLRLRQSVSALPGPAGEKRHQSALLIQRQRRRHRQR